MMTNDRTAKFSLWLSAIALIVPAAAHASPLSIVGTWSGDAPGQGGMEHRETQYQADGNYVSAEQLPNGTIERIWGTYNSAQIAGDELRISLRLRGVLPRQICAQAPGFPMGCRSNNVPPAASVTVRFPSESAFVINGVTMRRGGAMDLLRVSVPEQLVLAAPAPIRPNIPQPIMPGGRRYQTPNGPGSVAGIRADDQRQQYRICGVNNGTVVHNNDGTVTCVN